jgi:AcrR family transcriptional regulator
VSHARQEDTGRVNQKRRTRRNLLDAAGALLRAGATPSVAEVADAASVSRRTAYRYFPTAEQLLTEAVLEGVRPSIEGIFVGGGEGVEDVAERIERLAHALVERFRANEHPLRTLIRLTVDRSPAEGAVSTSRGVRRIDWIELAIAPLRAGLPRREYARLRAALAVCLGAEAFIVLRDVCGLGYAEMEKVTVYAARSLVGQARVSLAGASRHPRAGRT